MNCSTQEIPLWLGLQDEAAGLSPFPATASWKPEWTAQTYTHRFEIHLRVSPLPPSSTHHPVSPAVCTHSPVSQEADTQTSCTTPILVQGNRHTHRVTSRIHSGGFFPQHGLWRVSSIHAQTCGLYLVWASSDPGSSWCWSLPTHWLFQHIICLCMYLCVSHTQTHSHEK